MKQIRVRSEQINNAFVLGIQSYFLNTNDQNVISVSVTNQSASPYDLLIGLNEDPSSKLYLQAGESISFGPYRDGDLLIGNEFRFAWSTADNDNRAVIVVATETGKEICEVK
jgi:hypothetical protein